MKAIYVYFGYYEAWISDRILRAPLILHSVHKSLEKAIDEAERADVSVCIDRSLESEAREILMSKWDIVDEYDFRFPFTVFDGMEHALERGLSERTEDNLRRRLPCVPVGLDIDNLVRFLSMKMHISRAQSARRCEGKTYQQLLPVFSPYLKTATA